MTNKDSRIPIALSLFGSLAVPAAANTKSHTDCHTPPTISGVRRPNYGEVSNPCGIFTDANATDLLHDVHASECAAEVDGAQDDLNDEGVADADR